MTLTKEQNTCHELALSIVRQNEEQERNLVEVLIRAEELELPRAFELSSLFAYAVKELGLTKTMTGMVINVTRKAQRFPELRASIQAKSITVSKAHKFASSLTPENLHEWIEFAKTHTSCEIEDRAREQNPDKTKARKFHLSLKAEKLLKRAQSIESQRRRKPVTREEALEAALELFIEKKDPVVRADRVQRNARKKFALKPANRTDKQPGTEKPNSTNSQFLGTTTPKKIFSTTFRHLHRRVPLTAAQKNGVFARDRGWCQYVGLKGERCSNDSFTEIHHIVKVSAGGSNEPSNLETLCWFHHDLVHQLSLPLESEGNSDSGLLIKTNILLRKND